LPDNDILAKIDAAIKSITSTGTLPGGLMNTKQRDRFVRMAQNNTVVLPAARFQLMEAFKEEINRIGFVGRILGPPKTEGTALDPATDGKTPTERIINLESTEAQSIVRLTDKLLRRNIEKQNFESTLVDMIGERGGLDIEEWGINGDVGSSDPLFALNDGWLKLAERYVLEDAAASVSLTAKFVTGVGETTQSVDHGQDGVPITPSTYIIEVSSTQVAHDDGAGNIVQDAASGIAGTIDYEQGKVVLTGLTASTSYDVAYTAETFDENGDNFPEDMFDLQIGIIADTPYFVRRNEWRIYVPFWVEDAYRDLLRARGTALGDSAQTSAGKLVYKGVPIEMVPSMPKNKAWMTHPNNTVWGVFMEMFLEREREAKAKSTDFILNGEWDFNYENPEIAVTATIR